MAVRQKPVDMDGAIYEPIPAARSQQEAFRERLEHFLKHNRRLNQVGSDVSHYLHDFVLKQDENGRKLADTLHGKTLGHPLHPALTDLTIGSWVLGLFFDSLSFLTGSKSFRKSGDYLTVLGTMSAVPTIITGLLDYSTIKQDAVNYGAAHGLLNGAAFFCYARSTLARLNNHRGTGFFFALLGMLFTMLSSWLGGELVYQEKVGVNHSSEEEISKWTSVMPLDDLPEGQPTAGEVNGTAVLLFRRGDEISAINAVCSHAGGPLDEGQVVQETCIQCPWHQSVFDMRDGRVVHAPATYNQPRYQVRIHDGQVQVQSWDVEDEQR